MTNEEIRIKVAEAMGWKHVEVYEWVNDVRTPKQWADFDVLPNYPEDLNACSTFEATLTNEEQASYVRWLNVSHPTADIFYPDQSERGFNNKLAREVFGLVSATARQRCLAYLKTKGILP